MPTRGFKPRIVKEADVFGEQQNEEELARIYSVPIPKQPDLPVSYNITSSQNVLAI
jgi:hypothetical protein